ncbi:MAG: N-acetyltransferase [Gammaproteobacteria bacterium]|nr:N-acetyltransferase [Gammaproteobacteria bacterium]
MPDSSRVEIVPVRTGGELWRFIDVGYRAYAGDPAWVAPLRLERRLHLSRHNPFFQHGEWQAWMALRGSVPAGRISAQIDALHREHHGPKTGHFGMLEGIEDIHVFSALFGAAEDWLREQGATEITGPFSLSINQECGLLVDGFETPPVVMMPHGRPWYGKYVQEMGYQPARDLLAYWVNTDFTPPRVMDSLLRRYGPRVQLRILRRNRMGEELEILRSIFNDAWSENWGFVPFTEAEFAEIGTSLRLLVPDEFVQIAEFGGRPVAFIVALPNINEAAADLRGHLLPCGWVKLALRIKGERVRTGRVPLMGVRKEFQNTPLGIAIAFLLIQSVKEAVCRHGIREVEMSWILDDNKGMRHILEVIGSRLYKRYRIYRKQLGD